MAINKRLINSNNTSGGTPSTLAFFTGQHYNDQVSVADISNPASMTLLNTLTDSVQLDRPASLAIDNANLRLYVGCENGNRVTAVDFSNTSSLSISHTLTGINGCTAVAIDAENQILYAVSSTSYYLYAIDISNPSSMSIISSVYNVMLQGTYDMEIDVARGRAYIIKDAYRVMLFNISNPNSMSFITHIESFGAFNELRTISLDLVNYNAYVTAFTSQVASKISISNVNSLSLGSSYNNATNLQYTYGIDVDPSLNLVFVTGQGNNRLTSLNATTMTQLQSYNNTNFSDLSGPQRIVLDTASKICYVSCVSSDKFIAFDYSAGNGTVTQLGSITGSAGSLDVKLN